MREIERDIGRYILSISLCIPHHRERANAQDCLEREIGRERERVREREIERASEKAIQMVKYSSSEFIGCSHKDSNYHQANRSFWWVHRGGGGVGGWGF